jgi:hypothetical protein
MTRRKSGKGNRSFLLVTPQLLYWLLWAWIIGFALWGGGCAPVADV